MRHAFTIIEVLIALTILSFCVPVFVLSRQDLGADRVHRVRLAAEALCHNALERFARPDDDLLRYVKPVKDEPGTFEGADPWRDPALAAELGAPAALIARHDMHMELRLLRGVTEDLDSVTCKVSWTPEPGGATRDAVMYARHVLREGVR